MIDCDNVKELDFVEDVFRDDVLEVLGDAVKVLAELGTLGERQTVLQSCELLVPLHDETREPSQHVEHPNRSRALQLHPFIPKTSLSSAIAPA